MQCVDSLLVMVRLRIGSVMYQFVVHAISLVFLHVKG